MRIGVYICHCGSNIAGTIDIEEVRKQASMLYREAIDDAVCGRGSGKRCGREHTTGHYFRGVL